MLKAVKVITLLTYQNAVLAKVNGKVFIPNPKYTVWNGIASILYAQIGNLFEQAHVNDELSAYFGQAKFCDIFFHLSDAQCHEMAVLRLLPHIKRTQPISSRRRVRNNQGMLH